MRAGGMALRVWGRGARAVGRGPWGAEARGAGCGPLVVEARAVGRWSWRCGPWGASRTEARGPASEDAPDENAPALL